MTHYHILPACLSACVPKSTPQPTTPLAVKMREEYGYSSVERTKSGRFLRVHMAQNERRWLKIENDPAVSCTSENQNGGGRRGGGAEGGLRSIQLNPIRHLDEVSPVVRHVLLRVRDLSQQKALHVHPEVLDERCRPTRRPKVQPLVHGNRLVTSHISRIMYLYEKYVTKLHYIPYTKNKRFIE